MMQFIKKYYIYGIYILILLISIGVYVWGLMINNKNAEGYKKIEGLYKTAMSLSSKAVHDNEIKFYSDQLLKAQTDKSTVIGFCKATSSRRLLYPKVFPEAKADESKIHYIRYAEEYVKGIDSLLGPSGLNSGDKPTQLEEKTYLESSRRNRGTTATANARTMDGFGGAGGRGGTTQSSGSADQKLLDEFRENRAQEISIYANETSFVLYDFWKIHDGKSGTPESLQTDSWLSQLGYWIQEDVVISINKINDTTKSLKSNPVKRLIEVSFAGLSAETGTPSRSGVGAAATGAVGAAPARPTARIVAGGAGMGPSGGGRMGGDNVVSRIGNMNALPGFVQKETTEQKGMASSASNLAKPWTGHICDNLIDVVQMNVSVIMATDNINRFINALQSSRANIDGSNQRNQITVLEYNISPVNIQVEELAGYYYGSGAIAKVEFICEYVFFKEGYIDFVPEPVKLLTATTDTASSSSKGGGFGFVH